MYYGNSQSDYTNMRASYGPFGGVMAGGAYAQMGGGGGGGYYEEGPDQGGPAGTLQQIGSMVRPVSYMPPARVYVSAGGQYIQRGGLGPSFGSMVDYNEPPRNVSTQDYRMYASTDFAERASAGLASGMLTAAGLAAGSMLTPLGSALGGVAGAGVGGLAGSIFGPMGTLAGGAAGGAIGGLAGGLAMSFLPLMATQKVGDLLNQQMDIRNHLENSAFRFATSATDLADPRTASGMAPRARGAIAEHLTQMATQDPFLDLDEMTKILKGATGMGLMNNTQTVDEFKKKFKDITTNVKNIARVLNTTLEDGLKTMKDFRGIGITDANEVGRLVMQADVQGKVAGKTASEMVEVGMQGAEMFRGTGVTMGIGYRAAQMNISAIRAARDANVLSQEAVAQAGGEEALAQRMTASGLGFAQSQMGRGTLASVYAGGDKLSTAAIYKATSGQYDLPGMALDAARNLSNPKALLEFMANQPKLVSDLGKTFGGEGLQMAQMGNIMTQAKFYAQNTGVSVENGFRVSAQQMGVSEPEIQTMLARIKNADKEFDARQKALETTRAREQAENAHQNFFFTRFGTKIEHVGTSLISPLTNQIGRGIDTFTEGTKNWVEENIMGLSRANVSAIGYQREELNDYLSGIASGGKKPQLASGPRLPGMVDITEKGALSVTEAGNLLRHMDSLKENIGLRESTTAADAIVLERDKSAIANIGVGVTRGYDINHPGAETPIVASRAISQAELTRGRDILRTIAMPDEMAADIKNKSKTYEGVSNEVIKRASFMDLNQFKNYGSMITALTGKKDLSQVTEEEMASVVNLTKNMKSQNLFSPDRAGDLVEKGREDFRALTDVDNAARVERLKKAQKGYENIKADTEKLLGIPEDNLQSTDASFQKLISAENEKDPIKKEALLNQVIADYTSATGVQPSQIRQGLTHISLAANKKGGYTGTNTAEQINQYGRGHAPTPGQAIAPTMLKRIQESDEYLRIEQSRAGSTAIKEEALAKAEAATTDEERKTWKGLAKAGEAADPSEFLTYTKEHKKFLEEHGMGAQVTNMETVSKIPEQIKAYQKASGVGLTPQEETARKTRTPETIQKQITETEQNLKDTANLAGYNLDKRGLEALKTNDVNSSEAQQNIINKLTEGAKREFAGKIQSSAPGGSTGTQTATGGSPQEAFTGQVNINKEILNNLRALAQALRK